MAVVTFTDSITVSVSAAQLFKALILDSYSIVPKAVPHAVKSVELIEGNGGPGSIKQVNFAEGVPVKYVKQKIDVLDKDSLSYAETVIEGGELSDKITSITYEFKFEPSSDGGCTFNTIAKFHVKEGAEVTEEEVKPGKEAGLAMIKALEAYLLANPDA